MNYRRHRRCRALANPDTRAEPLGICENRCKPLEGLLVIQKPGAVLGHPVWRGHHHLDPAQAVPGTTGVDGISAAEAAFAQRGSAKARYPRYLAAASGGPYHLRPGGRGEDRASTPSRGSDLPAGSGPALSLPNGVRWTLLAPYP